MDAHALLTSQGWRGTGNSLHPTSNDYGLSRPLLVSKKQNTLGIGKKQHKTSDMWWMNAFDSSLKGLDTSKDGQVVQTVTCGGLDMVSKGGAKWVGSKGGLYASFVRGECLSGTITPTETESTGSDASVGKKRKREESKEERRARKAAKRAARATETIVEDKSEEKKENSDLKETKEERRARKAAKRVSKEEESKASESASTEDALVQDTVKPESKEERRERKRLKKLAQESDKEASDPEKTKRKKKRRKDE